MKVGQWIRAESRFLRQWDADHGLRDGGTYFWEGRVAAMWGNKFRLHNMAPHNHLSTNDMDIFAWPYLTPFESWLRRPLRIRWLRALEDVVLNLLDPVPGGCGEGA